MESKHGMTTNDMLISDDMPIILMSVAGICGFLPIIGRGLNIHLGIGFVLFLVCFIAEVVIFIAASLFLFKKNPHRLSLAGAIIFSLIALAYWGHFASSFVSAFIEF